MANIKRANTSGITKSGVAIPDVPDAPTIGAATNVGTARAFNNGSATVAFTAADKGGTSTSFTATSTPGSFTASGAGSPLTVTGLQSAASYTFTVTGTNASATGAASAASSSITATTVPQAPTIGTFTDGGTGTTGTLSFTAGATGGSTITNYKYSTNGSTYTALSPAQTSSPLSLTGLTAGTYNFSVKAVNANGDSAASGNVSGTVITPYTPETFYYTSSGTFTPSFYPATYDVYVLGGGGGVGGNVTYDSPPQTRYSYGGFGGGGYFASGSGTINSGSVTVTVGAAVNSGTGGTSTFAAVSAAGGAGGSSAALVAAAGSGGAGGSGGGAGGMEGYHENIGLISRRNAGNGGSGGGSGNASGADFPEQGTTPGNGGAGSGVANSGGGGGGSSGTTAGITVGGANYGSGRGLGYGSGRLSTGGYVVIRRNA
jgi:hypothetical protein